jgi:hypothetical protein
MPPQFLRTCPAGLCLMAVGMAAVGVLSSRGASSSPHHGKGAPPTPAEDAETRRLVDGSTGPSHAAEGEQAVTATREHWTLPSQ